MTVVDTLQETRDVKRNPKNRISILEMKSGSTPSQTKFKLIFCHFCQGNYIWITKCQV